MKLNRRAWLLAVATVIAGRCGWIIYYYRVCPLCGGHIDYSLWSYRKHFGIYHGGI